MKQPAVIGRERDQNPDRPSERTGEMRDGSIDGDAQIKVENRRRRVGVISKLIGNPLNLQVFSSVCVLRVWPDLQGEQVDARDRQRAQKDGERDGAGKIPLMKWVSGPGDPDFRAAEWFEPLLPHLRQRTVGLRIRNV